MMKRKRHLKSVGAGYDRNYAYEDTDVFMTMANLSRTECAGRLFETPCVITKRNGELEKLTIGLWMSTSSPLAPPSIS